MAMFRGAMIGLIHARSLKLADSSHDDFAAITLMSTDVDIICDAIPTVFEVWAQLIEVGIGFWLLARQLGWVSIVPLLIIVGESPKYGLESCTSQTANKKPQAAPE
jgi:ATP-binding cassette subfamily C (CFTR/MRP) protein 1